MAWYLVKHRDNFTFTLSHSIHGCMLAPFCLVLSWVEALRWADPPSKELYENV